MRTRFYVVLTETARREFRRVGVTDLGAHFRGRIVTGRGQDRFRDPPQREHPVGHPDHRLPRTVRIGPVAERGRPNPPLHRTAGSLVVCRWPLGIVPQLRPPAAGELVVRVRHEVADVSCACIAGRRLTHLLFCQQSPTGTCVAGNGGVRSSRDNVASLRRDGSREREPTLRLPASRRSGARIGWYGQPR